MRFIEKCDICYPKECIGTGEKRAYFMPMINEEVISPESFMDCPKFRGQIELQELGKKVKEKEDLMKPKLINYKTGETYEQL